MRRGMQSQAPSQEATPSWESHPPISVSPFGDLTFSLSNFFMSLQNTSSPKLVSGPSPVRTTKSGRSGPSCPDPTIPTDPIGPTGSYSWSKSTCLPYSWTTTLQRARDSLCPGSQSLVPSLGTTSTVEETRSQLTEEKKLRSSSSTVCSAIIPPCLPAPISCSLRNPSRDLHCLTTRCTPSLQRCFGRQAPTLASQRFGLCWSPTASSYPSFISVEEVKCGSTLYQSSPLTLV